MPTPERISNESAGVEASPGTICRCTADDRPALADLYRAPCPTSEGCVILDRAVRSEMWASGAHVLIVVP